MPYNLTYLQESFGYVSFRYVRMKLIFGKIFLKDEVEQIDLNDELFEWCAILG